jgi:hypothetical protein
MSFLSWLPPSLSTPLNPWLSIPLALLALLAYPALTLLYHLRSPLRLIPGPPSTSLLFGCYADAITDENLLFEWKGRYGLAWGGRDLLGVRPSPPFHHSHHFISFLSNPG